MGRTSANRHTLPTYAPNQLTYLSWEHLLDNSATEVALTLGVKSALLLLLLISCSTDWVFETPQGHTLIPNRLVLFFLFQ